MAVSHVKSNIVADFTGTVTAYNSQGSTVTVAATDLVRPSDWNSAHNQYSTIAGNTVGQSTLSGTNIQIAGGNNITLSANATQITISAANQSVQPGIQSISGGTTRATTGELVFSNSNGVSFGIDGQTITATVQTNYLTTAMASNAATISNIRVSAGTTSNLLSALTFANANGLSFGIDASTITGSYTVPAVTNSSMSVSDAASSGTLARLAFTNLNGVTLSLSTGAGGSHTIVGSHNGLTSQSNQNVTAANGGFAFQTLSFSNANGVSFGTSAGSAITGSVAAQTNQSAGIYAVGNTTGQSSSSTYDARTLSVDGAGIVSVGWSNSTLRISATQSNQAFSAGAASSTFQTLSFQDSNGFSFSNNAGAIRASYTRNVASNAIASVGSATNSGTNTSRFAADDHVHAGVFSVGVSNVGNTAGDTRVDVGRFVFAGGANITLSQATAANGLNTISVVAGAGGGETRLSAYAVSNTTQSTSGTIPLSAMSFHGAGIASVGVSNGSVVISVPAGGGGGDGGVFAGVSTGGNTLGSTGTVSTGNFVLVGSNGITLSQSTGAAGSAATITISGMQRTLSYYPYNPPVLATSVCNSGTTGATGGSSQTTASLFVAPFRLEHHHEWTNFAGLISGSTAAGTGSVTAGHMLGIYSRTGASISLVSSFVHNIFYSQNSVTAVSVRQFWGTNSAANSTSFGGNSSASITGARLALFGTGGPGSFTDGDYFVVHGYSHRTSGASIGAANRCFYITRQSYNAIQPIGQTAASNPWRDHMGALSITSNGTTTGYNCMPDTIATSQFSGQTATANLAWFSPIMFK